MESNNTKELVYKTEIDSDKENELMVTKGEGGKLNLKFAIILTTIYKQQGLTT